MDSLSWIAKRELGAGGRWREIWLLNRDRLPSPNLLYPGMALRIPSGAPAPSEAPLPPEAPPLQEPREAKRPLTAVSERRSESDTSPHELHVREVRDRWGETLQSVASELDLPVPVSAALCITEHRLAGFERDGELRIRFERQVFAGRTGQWISNLHRSPSDERLALASALTCDEQAAYASLAMGGAGLMGFRARLIGYASPRAMWEGMSGSEETQIRGLFSLLASEPDLLAAARFEDWIELARLVSRLRGSRSGCAVELERIARSYGGL